MRWSILGITTSVIMAVFSWIGPDAWEADFSRDTGEVLNIWCWNEEFLYCMQENYPGYKDNGDGTGTIGDVTVNWIVSETYDLGYQSKLKEALTGQKDADDDDKVDIFLVEADYAAEYTNAADVCISMQELGLTPYMSDQYRYTLDVVRDDEGNINGSAWMASPGIFAYRRSAAKQVFGTDDPEEIQRYFSDWDRFAKSAERLADKGWKALAGYDDAYRVYAQNVSEPWVKDGKICIDDNLMRWVEQTKDFTDKGYNRKTTQWTVEWMDGIGSSGDVFGYFGPQWFVDYSLQYSALEDFRGESEAGNGTWGDWAVIEGPQPYFWGGFWICVAQGCDNTGLAADIIYQLTCNEEVMEGIVSENWPFCNNREVMKRLVKDEEPNGFLGGQRALENYIACAESIRVERGTAYDWALSENFRWTMTYYFDGWLNLDEALDSFYTAAKEEYPELGIAGADR